MRKNKHLIKELLVLEGYLFILLFLGISYLQAQDTLNLNQLIYPSQIHTDITGVGAEGMHDQVVYEYDNSGNVLHSYFNPTLTTISKQMNLQTFRFPGGTNGNYYHFYGNGYGIDTSESNCAPGRVGNSFIDQNVQFNTKAPRNFIYYFNEQLQSLKQAGNTIGVYYMLNMNTHYYKKDMTKYNTTIAQKLISYSYNNPALYTDGGDYLDSTKTYLWVNFLNLVLRDTFFTRMKYELAHDSAFMYRFQENMNAIRFLKSQGINILGAELGNETFSEYYIFDDDLSDLGFDCTNAPDTLYITTSTAPMRTYLKGLLKYKILASIYADTLHAMQIKTGIPFAQNYSYVNYNATADSIFYVQPYTIVNKKSDLWNDFLATQNIADAVIPHIYFQQIASCDFYSTVVDKLPLHKLMIRFFDYYAQHSLPIILRKCVKNPQIKDIWVTEWNFDANSYSNNTMLSAYYIYDFVKALAQFQINDTSVHIAATYHSYSNTYAGFSLIRSGFTNPGYYAIRQLMCFPFEHFSSTFHKNVYPLKPEVGIKLQLAQKTADCYFSVENKTLDIHFTNTDTLSDYILLKNKVLYIDGQAYSVKKTKRYIIDANGYTSNNYSSCPSVIAENSFYSILYDSAFAFVDSLPLPPISLGKFTLELEPQITTSVLTQTSSAIKLYPNPAQNKIILEFNADLSKVAEYSIFTMDGKMVQNGQISSSKTEISIANLPSGLYGVRINNQLHIIDNLRFVKF